MPIPSAASAPPAMPGLLSYLPERIWQARRAFFDDGGLPDGLVDDPVLRSWRRCRGLGREVAESVAFDPVDRGTLARLLDAQHHLLQAARPALTDLAGAVAGAGYAVLLTDAAGRALAVEGALAQRSRPLRQAFRAGVDLSEAVIGTNAMCAAMAEGRAVRVLGPEHYFADNQLFHCCAAPVFDPAGRVVASVDVSRDTPGMAAGALMLTQLCARRIERRLFDALPSFLRLRLASAEPGGEAWLAFDHERRLLGATPAARHLLALAGAGLDGGFEDWFEGSFDAAVQAARHGRPATLHLRGGVCLQAHAETGTSARAAGVPAVAPRAVQGHGPVWGDAAFEAAFARARRAHDADLPVLVTGETGVGKEVAARALHDAGERRRGPFVALNCGAIAPQLMAAELFGHVEGAYTGARRGGSPGRFEAAHGGTLLLDEIGDMPLELQVGLLRVLDSGEVTRVGAARPVRTDVRIVCATHCDLRALVSEGRFREDLYFRLGAFTLEVPPLRARSDFDGVLDALLVQQGLSPRLVDAGLRAWLRARPWPGNVRQLRHALRLAAALAERGVPLQASHFQVDHDPAPAAPGPAATQPLRWDDAQHQAIEQALQATRGNVTAAAALLGIGRATLYRKLRGRRR